MTDKDLNIYELDSQLLETLFYVFHYLKLRIYKLLKSKNNSVQIQTIHALYKNKFSKPSEEVIMISKTRAWNVDIVPVLSAGNCL